MRLLADTHLLIWAGYKSDNLSRTAKAMMGDASNQLYFSVISVWEVAIKRTLGHKDFDVDAAIFRRQLLDNGYVELDFVGNHAVMVQALPLLHRDPFDRGLVAQARAEGMTLLTSDKTVGKYGDGVQRV